MAKYLFTSESVTEGHPDKVCDQISDAILDAILSQDENAHVACETTAVSGQVNIMGEISAAAQVDFESVARKVICGIGYDRDEYLFNGNNCKIVNLLTTQSPDIAMGVNEGYEKKNGENDALNSVGAGDQGMMFGYACNEAKELMPFTISLAHSLAKRLTAVRKNGTLPYLRPDGKTQVTGLFDGGRLIKIDSIVISAQHDEDISREEIKSDLIKNVITPVIPPSLVDESTRIFVNPTGRFVIGGPAGDSGLTGRKIIVDTYGGVAKHGGGSFSGKDPTKVDRSAAYYARYIAKNIVASGVADKCEIQLAYAIGVSRPVSVMADTFGTGKVPDEKIVDAVKKVFDMRPLAIINELNLRKVKYLPLASYGHMGREDLSVPWEKTDRAESLKQYFK